MQPSSDNRNFNILDNVLLSALIFHNANPANKKMNLNPQRTKDLLQKLHDRDVKYMIVGGYAIAFHGNIRATVDLDLWIRNDPENMKNLRLALQDVGFPEAVALRETSQLVAGFSQIKDISSDLIIDLIHNLKALKEKDFDACYSQSILADYNGAPVRVIDLHSLYREKLASGRPKDADDIAFIKRRLDSAD